MRIWWHLIQIPVSHLCPFSQNWRVFFSLVKHRQKKIKHWNRGRFVKLTGWPGQVVLLWRLIHWIICRRRYEDRQPVTHDSKLRTWSWKVLFNDELLWKYWKLPGLVSDMLPSLLFKCNGSNNLFKHHGTIISDSSYLPTIPTLPIGESLTRSPLRQVRVLSGSVMIELLAPQGNRYHISRQVEGSWHQWFFHPGVVWWCFSSYCIFWSVPLILCMQWKDEWCISKRWQLVLSYWWNDVPETYTDSKSFLPLAVGLVNFLRLTCFSPVVPAEDCFGNKTYKPGQTRWLVEEIVLAAPMPIAKDGPRKPWKRGLRFACYIVC